MKRLGYYFFRYWVSLGLFFYYQKIEVVGLENIPEEKPVLFLSNHQNALLDVLLIATRCKRKPWFLARADIFRKTLFRTLFQLLQMMPVYRLRDGKASLVNNDAIFKKSAELLNENASILIFPEANHSLKRRIRPLSKGFTRIVFKALEQNPASDIHLVPIGQNYQYPMEFGDSAALYFGKAIRVQDFISSDINGSTHNMKIAVLKGLKQLTTHIENEEDYDTRIRQLDAHHINYLYPKDINKYLQNAELEINSLPKKKATPWSRFFKLLFYLINLPIILVWRIFVKPKVPEQEFLGTFRFGYAIIVYPLFYICCFLLGNYAFNIKTACLFVVGHAVLNLSLIKRRSTLKLNKKTFS